MLLLIWWLFNFGASSFLMTAGLGAAVWVLHDTTSWMIFPRGCTLWMLSSRWSNLPSTGSELCLWMMWYMMSNNSLDPWNPWLTCVSMKPNNASGCEIGGRIWGPIGGNWIDLATWGVRTRSGCRWTSSFRFTVLCEGGVWLIVAWDAKSQQLLTMQQNE